MHEWRTIFRSHLGAITTVLIAVVALFLIGSWTASRRNVHTVATTTVSRETAHDAATYGLHAAVICMNHPHAASCDALLGADGLLVEPGVFANARFVMSTSETAHIVSTARSTATGLTVTVEGALVYDEDSMFDGGVLPVLSSATTTARMWQLNPKTVREVTP